MSLKYKFTELVRNRVIAPDLLYDQLKDIDRQISDGADAVPIVKENVKLTKTALKKAFGDPSKFQNIAIVHNTEGSYLIIAHNKGFQCVALENI